MSPFGRRTTFGLMAAALACAALSGIASATTAPEVAKTLQPGNTVQAVQGPLRMPHQAARQRISADRGKSGLPQAAAPAQFDIYARVKIESSPRVPDSPAIAKALEKHAMGELQKQKEATTTQRQASTAAFTPLCPTLDINTLYTLTGSQVGTPTCYHFSIAQRSKSTVILTGQNTATDFALMLLKDDGANNLSVVGTSDVIGNGNGDEFIISVTDPGHYYWWSPTPRTVPRSTLAFRSMHRSTHTNSTT